MISKYHYLKNKYNLWIKLLLTQIINEILEKIKNIPHV